MRGAGSVCEAAYLASLKGVKVNVLVSRSSQRALSKIYKGLAGDGELNVQPLVFQSRHLNTERMQRLMAFSEQEGTVTLHMEVSVVLRGLRLAREKLLRMTRGSMY